MRHELLGVACAALVALPLPVLAAEPVPEPEWIGRSRELVQQLGGELKGELARALSAGGPVAAIAVCRERAPLIAARLSTQSGASVGRTALRVRNPANAPDALERAVLEQFVEDFAAAQADGPVEAMFEIKRGDGIEHRYMRAIPTEGVCLACHGPSLDPALAAAIARDYPEDAATGFKAGELRGAFTVIWPPSPAPPANASPPPSTSPPTSTSPPSPPPSTPSTPATRRP